MARRLAPEEAKTGTVRFSLGLCTTAHGQDIAAWLFRRTFVEALIEIVRPLITVGGRFRGQESIAISQDAVLVGGTDPFHDNAWDLRAAWDGSVGVAYDAPEEEHAHLEHLAGQITDAWALALDIAERLGGHGDHFIAVRLTGKQFVKAVKDKRDPGELPLITRGPMTEAARTDHHERLLREIQRIAGKHAVEPEPPADDAHDS